MAGLAGSRTVPANATDFVGGVLPSGTVLFGIGETARMLTVNVAADGLVELNDRFAVTLTSPSPGATIATATADAIIFNDDTSLSIAATSASKPEGTGGSTAFTFTVSRNGDTSVASSVAWAVTGSGANPASAADFEGGVLPTDVVDFAAGDLDSKTITILVAADSAVDPDEDFTVTLSGPTGATLGSSSASGTIQNDDVPPPLPTVSIGAASANKPEGSEGGTTPFTFTVNRSGDLSVASSVAWAVTGSGVNPASAADFAGGLLPSGKVSFAALETSQKITVSVAGDNVIEPDESFTVTLFGAGGVSLGVASAEVTIQNDDGTYDDIVFSTKADETFHLGAGTDTVVFSAARENYRIGISGEWVGVRGSDGSDTLKDVEWLQFGATAPITVESLRGQSGTDDLMSFITGGKLTFALPLEYSGPLDLKYVYPGTDKDDVVAGTPFNDFINLGSDAR